MSDLLDFAGALTGLYDGPIAFDLNGEPYPASEAEAITAQEGQLYIQALQEDGTVPFVWGIQDEASPTDWNACRLKPTAVLHQDGTMILFWAFDTPMPAEALGWVEEAFDMKLDEPVPTPGANGWELVRLDAETFYTYEDFERAYGDPAPSDGAIYAAVSKADADKAAQAEIEALAAEVQAEPQAKPKKKAAAKKKAPVKVKAEDEAPWDEEPVKYGDAFIRSAYDESNPVLHQDIVVTVGANAETYNWKPQTIKLGQMMAMLCQHKEGKKDGLAWVLGDMVAGKRGINSVKTLTSVGLDIDTGMSGADLDKALKKLGLMAVRYTTHSHMKSRTKVRKDIILNWIEKNHAGLDIEDPETVQLYLIEAKKYEPQVVTDARIVSYDHSDRGIEAVIEHMPMPKHRIVLPMAAPYDIAEESKGTSQKAALEKWRLIPKALARDLGDLPIDKTGSDPNRLFYLPRHDKGAPFEISLFGGDLFDWRTIQLVDSGEELDKFLNQGKSKSTTSEGRDLGRWSIKRAHGFQIADLVRSFAPERIRSDTGLKIEIECPFDEHHSNPGDPEDRACMAVNAGDGPSEIFTVSCRHESCQERTNLDMVGKMIADGWFDREDIDKEDFNALLDEEAVENATPQQAKRIEEATRIELEDTAREEYQIKAEAITAKSTAGEIEDALKTILEANLSSLDEARAIEMIQKKLGLSSPRFKAELNRIKREITASKDKKGQKQVQLDDGKRLMFTYSGEIDFHAATEACFGILRAKNEEEGLPHFASLEHRPVRLTHSKTGRTRYDEISSKTLWSELNKYITFVRTTDDGGYGPRASVPKEVGDQVYETIYEEMPYAPEIIYTPIFDSKGRLISEPGYYEDEGLLIPSLDFEAPNVPEAPSEEEVKEAVRLLADEMLIDFPFSDYDSKGVERREPSRANALAMILTPFMRRMINGCTPVFFVSKPVPGTGGTYLGKIPILLFDGEEGAPMIYTENPDEMAKALLAGALAAKSHMFFDDVKSFNNREIMRAITSTQVGGRVLGASRNIEVANRFNWIATGNNPDIKPEMGRRVVTIRLNLKDEEINNRVFKGHPNLHEWLKDNRSQIIGAILTLIQHWQVNTKSKPFKDRKLASFEDWAEKVGGVLQAAGIEGFLDNRKMAEADMDEAATRMLVRDWFKKYSDRPVTANDLFGLAEDNSNDLIDGNPEDKRTRNKFFKHLNHIENRVFIIGAARVVVIKTIDEQLQPVFILQIQD
ncbi:PE-PGRS family protein [Caulobacter phage CcrSC]|uniref:PE-PGRS family protein n=1 Tax=Caulobacter phage CcrSC TaxID=2283272 RepID=A0A385EDR3_9CAUD|nr:PE-PGRS family protein [Caulobacter phage CcrSC]AXQ69800.1 PE-PGRS family protein [Caulobacter phage CcrSC]